MRRQAGYWAVAATMAAFTCSGVAGFGPPLRRLDSGGLERWEPGVGDLRLRAGPHVVVAVFENGLPGGCGWADQEAVRVIPVLLRRAVDVVEDPADGSVVQLAKDVRAPGECGAKLVLRAALRKVNDRVSGLSQRRLSFRPSLGCIA